jgi:shikimate dehydrogenase
MMRTFGLIGYPLSHSFSALFFSEKFKRESIRDSGYSLFPLPEISELPSLLAEKAPLGLNVTIPYKVSVLPFVDALDAAAAEIGAVNCLKISHTGSKLFIKGYNTDAYGFEASLRPLLQAQHQKALIFGDGGAASAVKYVLNQLGISFISVLRRPASGGILYQDLNEALLLDHSLLINTTPVGTFPNVDACPDIPYQFVTAKHLAYDLVYNPEETLFLKMVKEKGGTIKNGLEMLQLQAERSWEIWNTGNEA